MKPKFVRLLKWLGKLILEEAVRPYIFLLLSGGGLWAFIQILYSHVTSTGKHVLQTPPTEWSLIEISIVLITLALLLTSIYYLISIIKKNVFPRKSARNYRFEPEIGLLWKYSIYEGVPESIPYCPKHQVKLRKVGFERNHQSFECNHCENQWRFAEYELRQAYERVSNTIQAKVEGHFKK